MRTFLIILLLACAPAFTTSCTTAPSSRVVAVQTLKSVGQTAETSVAISAQLYKDGRITAGQARQVMDVYDKQFQPAFRIAVITANSNLESIASPDLMNIATQLAAMVANLQSRTP
jgi:polyhydroxyalkanoate synthesis regulator phasin